MIVATADTSFGNRGAMWSGVPYLWTDPSSYTIERLDDETHYPGGSAVGIHRFSSGSACVVLAGYDYLRPGWDSNAANAPPVVRLVVFPPDGRCDDGWWGQAAVVTLTPKGEGATFLGSCKIAGDRVAVLVRGSAAQHELITFRPSGPGSTVFPGAFTRRTIPSSFLDYGAGLGTPAQRGSLLIVPRLGDVAVASSNARHDMNGKLISAKVLLPLSIELIYDIDLLNNNMLPGLVWIELAGVRFEGDFPVIAMTAHLNLPGVGGTSVGAVLRLRPDGSRDATFGNNGLWVSPLNVAHRDFVCAGEFGGIVAGCIGRRARLFAIDRNDSGGDGLDTAFGSGNGFVECDLGGPLSNPVAAADANALYVFAQRVPTQADPSGDGRAVGCRFNIGSSAFGTIEQGFGNAGTVTIWSDGVAFEPAGIVLSGSQVFLGGTRRLMGEDCDRVPVTVVMDAANGDPIPDYGFGGFSLHGSISSPVYIAPDGSSVFADRSRTSNVPALRYILPSGEVGTLVPLPPSYQGAKITSILGLADGSLLVAMSATTAGTGRPASVIKLTPARALDASFGTAGVFQPKPDADYIWILGVRTDGKVALQINIIATAELAVMLPGGQLEATFGVNGFLTLRGFTDASLGITGSSLNCFLDEDDAVICVAHSGHDPGSTFSPYVRVALRRITSVGAYDEAFGLGAPSVAVPSSSVMATLISPAGGTTEYSGVSPRAIWRAGGKLYLFAAGIAGGGISAGRERPKYPVFIVFRWNSNGSRDLAFFATGWEEWGFYPNTLYWSPTGVLKYSADTAIVYGQAGAAETVQSSTGGQTSTNTLIREPKPALFKFDHDAGLDMSFGQNGAARFPLWGKETLLTSVGGALLSNGRVRVACVDVLMQQRSVRPQHNFAGLLQWELRDVIPAPSISPWLSWFLVIALIAFLAIVIYSLMK